MTNLSLASLVFCSLALGACAGGGSSSGGSKDPSASCQTMCSNSGYSGSRLEEYPNETNCFCTGGTANVSDAECRTLCDGLGKSGAQTFGSTGTTKDSCQCS